MAAATSTKKQDTRKPNLQPNALPAQVVVEVIFDGKVMGTIGVAQGDKLSNAGAITYFGGITKNWKLPGDSSTALAALAFTVNGTALSRSTGGVHANKADNPCVFHSTVVDLPNTGGEPMAYMSQITATYRADKGYYTLQILASPVRGGGGPVVRGEIVGSFEIDGFEG